MPIEFEINKKATILFHKQVRVPSRQSSSSLETESFFYGADVDDLYKEKTIQKIDLSTFKQLYDKSLQGKYLQSMFMLLKRQILKDRLETANQEAKKNHAHSPVKPQNKTVNVSYAI